MDAICFVLAVLSLHFRVDLRLNQLAAVITAHASSLYPPHHITPCAPDRHSLTPQFLMPYYKKKRKAAYKKKPYKKHRMVAKFGKNSKYVIRYNGPTWLPSEFVNNHQFTFNMPIVLSATSAARQFNILNIRQCLVSGANDVGVVGLENMANLYLHWRVLHATAKVTIINHNTLSGLECTLRPIPGNVVPTDVQIERINQYAKYMILSPQDSGRAYRTFTSSINPDRLIRRKLIYDDDAVSNGTGTTTGPGVPYCWNLMIHNIEDLATLDLRVVIHLTYRVKWYDRSREEPDPA